MYRDASRGPLAYDYNHTRTQLGALLPILVDCPTVVLRLLPLDTQSPWDSSCVSTGGMTDQRVIREALLRTVVAFLRWF